MGCTITVANCTDTVKSQRDISSSCGSSDDKRQALKVSLKERFCLNERQKFLILKSWKGISREITSTGVNMFVRMFETNQDVRKYFTDINKNNSISEIRQNNKMKGHCLTVMHTIDDAISSFQDINDSIELLLSVAKIHQGFNSFRADDFWKIKEPFLLSVKETLGDRYTANMEDIYEKSIHFILLTLTEGFHLYNS